MGAPVEQWRSWWALCGRACSRCMTRRSGGRRSTPDILPRWPRDVDFAGVGRHCGKRLRERLREATGNCGSEATGNCGSGGGTPCSGGANRVRGQQSGAIHGLHSPGLQLRTPARQTKRSHPDSDRASATLHVHESRTRDLVSRSCGSSINPEVICRKNMSYERTVASQNCCIRAHDARRTISDGNICLCSEPTS